MFRLLNIGIGRMASGPFRTSHMKKRNIMMMPYIWTDLKQLQSKDLERLTKTMVIMTPALLQGFVLPPHWNPVKNKNTPMKLSTAPIQSSLNHVSKADFLCTVKLGKLGTYIRPKAIPKVPIYHAARLSTINSIGSLWDPQED